MLKLQPGKSYAWIFAIYAVIFVLFLFGTTMRGPWLWAAPALISPVLLVYLIACQIASGVALDAFWRAEFLRGTWQYRATLAWQVFGVVVFLVIACLAADWSTFEPSK